MTNKEKWIKILSDWKSSGLSRAEYCRKNKIACSTFDYWKLRIRREHGSDTTEKLVKLPISAPQQDKPYILIFPKGLQLQIPTSYRKESLQNLIQEILQCC